MPAPADRFDEVRRKWIARNQRTFIFQKRRAEILARQIRDRATENSGARVDPADDDIVGPFLLRSHRTVYAAVDAVIVGVAAALAPLGWPAGRALYGLTVRLIPDRLRSYPVAAWAWAAVATGLPLPLLYRPADSIAGTVLLPYLVGQIPAAALAAALCGVMNGWLAVAGARDWWPMRPPPAAETVDFGWEPDPGLPGVFPAHPAPDPGERTPIHRDRR